jgi:tRNA(Ile)-lysidine synthase
VPNAANEPPVERTDFVSRLYADVVALIGDECATTSQFGVAVSGGPDSMALLALAADAFPGRIVAATVDHGLRPGAADEARMVHHWCGERSIPHTILRPAQPIVGNIQSAARQARYALLETWRNDNGIGWLMTAHHADDQCETILMRLNRASGVSGLAGVRARNGRVLRPMLGWLRAELGDVVATRALPHVTDPSNNDLRFDRVAMRNRLAETDWIDAPAFARSAAALAEAEEALEWTVAGLAERHIQHDNDAWMLTRSDFPREILRRLILRMLAQADPDAAPPRGETLDKAIVQGSQGKQVSIGHWLLSGGPVWRLSRAPQRGAR